MASSDPETSNELLRLLISDDLADRMPAIMALGEMGDEAALGVAEAPANDYNEWRGGRGVPDVADLAKQAG